MRALYFSSTFWNMRKFNLLIFVLVACADYGLPGSPYVYTPVSTNMGDSIYIKWSSVEGADFYRVYADSVLVYEGSETHTKLGYTKSFIVKADGLRDETESIYELSDFVITETLLVKPQTEVITFENGNFSISSVSDSGKYSYFVMIFSQTSTSFGSSDFHPDSLWIYSASPFFSSDITAHKVDTLENPAIVNLPQRDSVKLYLHKDYVLWYSPDTMGWDSLNDIFVKFRVDSLITDSLESRLRVILNANMLFGLRWFY